jgi:hypothetical protein
MPYSLIHGHTDPILTFLLHHMMIPTGGKEQRFTLFQLDCDRLEGRVLRQPKRVHRDPWYRPRGFGIGADDQHRLVC